MSKPREITSDRFAHLHVHTEYSVLDGLGTVREYVDRAAELKQPALAITDHGGVWGAPEHYFACRKAGIEPIIGEEFYYVPDAAWRPAKGEKVDRFHVTVLARGATGYQVLSELSSASHEQFYHKALLDDALLDSLGDAAEHLTVLSGCATSRLSRLLQKEDEDEARIELLKWREWFPNFYIELMHHDTSFDKRLNESLVEMAQRYDIPWVITNDPHYVIPEDDCHHDALLAIQTAADLDDPDRFRFDGTGYHLKSRSEMRRAFTTYGDEIWKPGARNTLRVAKDCYTRIPGWENRVWQIPRFPDLDEEEGETSFGLLKKLAWRGLRRRGLNKKPEYVDRMKSELRIIKSVGIADFLLITWDIVEEARRRRIPVGPGRGSVCGTLVGWLIGIHKVDPIRYRTLFERFLNPERPRMPDIDTDFGQARRDELFIYAEEKYGTENVMHVATYQRMKAKAAFQSLAKAYGVSWADRQRFSKEVVEDSETGEFVIPEEMSELYPDLYAQMERLSGTKRGFAAHPAGIIIADPSAEVRKQMPKMWIPSGKGRMVGQYNLYSVEDLGLMKQDFLGLRTLDTIDYCLDFIEARTGERLDPDEWIPDEEPGDDAVYDMLARGYTAGVFQMEGPVNQRGCKAVVPNCFEDLVSITSLYRTGPIQAKFPARFIGNRKAGKIAYVHPSLEPILSMTWGVILYQEQVMEIAATCAGFDMIEVDEIKEAIKHKKSALMVSMRPKFIKGCRDTVGMSRAAATEIWDAIEGYSGYSYNRSHAVAYSLLTYQTARLKCMYPVEFCAALLVTVPNKKDNVDKREVYLREALDKDIQILPPDVNASNIAASPEGDLRAVRFGLSDLAGIGPAAALRVVGARPEEGYTTLEQVTKAANNVGVLRLLTEGSALESIGVAGAIRRTEELLHWTMRDDMVDIRKKFNTIHDPPAKEGDDCVLIGRIYKQTTLTTKAGKTYVRWKIRWSQTAAWDLHLWSECEYVWKACKHGDVVKVSGKWSEKWENVSVGNPRMITRLNAAGTKFERIRKPKTTDE